MNPFYLIIHYATIYRTQLKKNIMKKYLIYSLIIISSTLLLTGCTKKETNYDASKIKLVDSSDSNDETNTSELAPDNIEEKEDDTDLGYLSNPNEFTKETQETGDDGESNYNITSVLNSSENGYHRITFTIEKTEETENWNKTVAQNIPSEGVIRLTFNNIADDNTHISYQDTQNINKGAINGIYHSVTSKELTEIYEIGVSGNNPFKLSTEEGDGKLNIHLDIAYDLEYNAPDIDFGSTEFSNTDQSIEGMTKDDGVKITNYSYSVSGGVLRFVLTVASGTSNPIPTTNASYDEMNILNVTFPSLDTDKVSTWGSTIGLPAGIEVEIERVGDSSVYKFGGIGGTNDYKLSANKSPNQVVIEVKL